jgi:uncharacterized protein (TIGR02996 family)
VPTVAESNLSQMFAAVMENPGDDRPRLIWADALEEATNTYLHPRAEFVRVQCELVRGVSALLHDPESGRCDCRGCVLRRREVELLREHWKIIIPGIDGLHVVYRGGNSPAYGWFVPGKEEIIEATFSRGWPSAVTLPLAAWVGGECQRCRDQPGWAFVAARLRRCPDCKGETRTPALGPLIAASCPLWPTETAVRLSDKDPSMGFIWYRQIANDAMERSVLPAALWDLLDGYVEIDGGAKDFDMYPYNASPKAANHALSRACMKLARLRRP